MRIEDLNNEIFELTAKIEKLNDFIYSTGFKHRTKEEQVILIQQSAYMLAYKKALNDRARLMLSNGKK